MNIRIVQFRFFHETAIGNAEELGEETFQLINDCLFLLGSLATAKAGNRRHQGINICSDRSDFSVAEGIFKEFAGFSFFQIFLHDDAFQFFFALMDDIIVPFLHNIVNIIDIGNEAFDQVLLVTQFGAAVNGLTDIDVLGVLAVQEGDTVKIDAASIGVEKVLGGGQVTHKIAITAEAFSASAVAKIEEKGGQALSLE